MKEVAAVSKTIRDSNLELLRIIAMMMIIALHQNGSANALTQLPAGQANFYIANAVESLSICSVNCFVLLSGYFMIKKNAAPVKKCVHLMVDIAFWGGVGCLLNLLVFGERATFKELIVAMIPLIKGNRWFVRDFIILMLLSPFLNNCLTRLSKRNYRLLIAVVLTFFSLWPSFFPNPPIDDYGFSCVHFVQLYVIAGYLRLHWETNAKPRTYILCFFGSSVVIFISAIYGNGYAYAYNYIFTIISSVCLFMIFKGFRLQIPAINFLASGAFDVFLIHTTPFFADLIYVRLFHVDTSLYGAALPYLIGLLVCPPIFYLFSSALATAKSWLFSKTVDPLIERLPIKNYSL